MRPNRIRHKITRGGTLFMLAIAIVGLAAIGSANDYLSLGQHLRAITRKCRPDWDITTPEMKAAWQEGGKKLFYPFGKTYVQTLGEQD